MRYKIKISIPWYVTAEAVLPFIKWHMQFGEENPKDTRVQPSYAALSTGNRVFPVISTGDTLTIGFMEQWPNSVTQSWKNTNVTKQGGKK